LAGAAAEAAASIAAVAETQLLLLRLLAVHSNPTEVAALVAARWQWAAEVIAIGLFTLRIAPICWAVQVASRGVLIERKWGDDACEAIFF
jgi:hypothetical protein